MVPNCWHQPIHLWDSLSYTLLYERTSIKIHEDVPIKWDRHSQWRCDEARAREELAGYDELEAKVCAPLFFRIIKAIIRSIKHTR